MVILKDCIVLTIMHLVLVVILIISISSIFQERWRLQHGAIKARIRRGEWSMTLLYTSYGVTTLVFVLAVQSAEVVKGYKVGIILFDYIVLSYLFFFNSWFKNWLIGKLRRIDED